MKKQFSKSFLARGDEAAFWEAYVAATLARRGLYVLHEPMEFGDYHDPSKSLQWDITVYPAIDSGGIPVEVKSRGTFFLAPEDMKLFPDVNLCSQSWFLKNWSGQDTLGRDFLLVSTASGAILWVPAGTKVKLGKEVRDHERNELYKVVTCQPEAVYSLAEFVTMVKSTDVHNKG